MDLRIGTFNLNNLFSRWNFTAQVDRLPEEDQTVTYTFAVDAEGEDDVGGPTVRFRTFQGRLVHAKDPQDTAKIGARILALDLDVLAVQEVENLPALKEFNAESLADLYPHQVLIEGNDHRLIDVALLSKLPLRRIVSHQTEVHPAAPAQRVFGRDLLQVEVWDPTRSRRLFTVFNSHAKSNFVPWWIRDPAAGTQRNHERRLRQSQTTVDVIGRDPTLDGRYLVLGDLNQNPDHFSLAPITDGPLRLVDALADVEESAMPRPSSGDRG